ncbi:MAG: patatin-like phospholipase family protein [Acidimicrobiales bacterium]
MEHAAPRVGLVLGAGGVAGGAFHAGVLAALEEVTGWDPRTASIVVGTSAGSVTGTVLRAGLSAADELARATGDPLSRQGARLVRAVGTPDRISPLRPTRERVLPAQVVGTLARAAARPFGARPWALLAAGLLPEGSTSTELISGPIAALGRDWPPDPLWICAVRQADGRRVVFGRGTERAPLPEAVAASCAIPTFFQPVTIDGASYFDGGVHSPTNADVLRGEAANLDLVLVSSPMSLAGRGLRLGADQAVRRWSGLLLDSEARGLRRRGVHVVAFQPTGEDIAVMGLNAMDESRRGGVARQARASTLRRLERSDARERLAALFG